MSVDSLYNLGKRKVKKYSACYTNLSNLILNMTEKQQSLLLKQAYQNMNDAKKSDLLNGIQDKKWIFIWGILVGWFISSLPYMIFAFK